MLIGVISDTHDNLPRIAAATELFAQRGVETMLHAGDYVAPFALKLLLKSDLPLIGVFGNNDGERRGLGKVCATVYEPPHRFDLDGRTIVLAHASEALDEEATEGADLVVHGHTHEPFVHEGPPLTVNPGEAGGWLSGRCTVALVDLDAMQAEIVDLEPQETVVP